LLSDCIFCKIVTGQIPSTKVYEDDHVLAFKDIAPVAPVHILVIPKCHLASVNDLGPADGALLGHLFTAVQKVAADQGLVNSGYRVVTNSGKDSGQVVFHLHFHVIGGKALNQIG